MSLALYRKYRSKSLDEIVGQAHITDILKRAIAAGRISHAYLLTGPRGVGKTSVARILAHEINGLPYSDDSTHLDIIEIDAASNNGVEDVRDLRDKVQIAPVSANKKIYIIDEVHMLSKPAFNALLKTLEEPPEHVVFILATTDVDKLPATIVSRTQRFGFRAIGSQDAIKHLGEIAKKEGIKIDEPALAMIAERGDGSFRDSISLLDQLASLADKNQGITTNLVEAALGLAPTKLVETLLKSVDSHDIAGLASQLQSAANDGISMTVLTSQLTSAVQQRIVENTALLPLLDALLDVPKSTHPQIKLLSVLGTAALENKPKSAALASPVREVSATIEELSKQADKPSEPQPSKKSNQTDQVAFDWQKLVQYVRKHHVALHSVLAKCGHHLDNTNLTLYTLNNFYKKKLDDPKYRTLLHQSLEAIGSYQLTIHTIPTATPIKNSQTAAVAAIMGGGEEVSLEAS